MATLIGLIFVLLGDLLKLWLAGLAVFILFPIVTVPLPDRYADPITGFYFDVTMALLGSAILLQRSNGGLQLKKTTFDPTLGEAGAEVTYIKSEEKSFMDPKDLMSTWRDRPFGLAHEDRAVIIDARTAFLGRRFAELKRAGRWVVDGKRKAYFALNAGHQTLVRLEDALSVIQHKAAPGITDRIDSYAEKGQAEFNTGTRMQQAKLFIALGVGLGAMFLLKQVASSTGGGSIVGGGIPI